MSSSSFGDDLVPGHVAATLLEAVHAGSGLGEGRILMPRFPVGAAVPRPDHGPLVVSVERDEQLSTNPAGPFLCSGEALAHRGIPFGLAAGLQPHVRNHGHHLGELPRRGQPNAYGHGRGTSLGVPTGPLASSVTRRVETRAASWNGPRDTPSEALSRPRWTVAGLR